MARQTAVPMKVLEDLKARKRGGWAVEERLSPDMNWAKRPEDETAIMTMMLRRRAIEVEVGPVWREV